MLIEDLIGTNVGVGIQEIQTIKRECSQFLTEAAGSPLLKALPETYFNFHKVKVRLQKRHDQVSEVFERAFGSEFANLRQRAVFSYPVKPHIHEGSDLFYVFPINGYKYLYSKEVSNSGTEYQHVIDTMCEQFDDPSQASDLVSDLLKYTYVSDNLREGIAADSEIILYGIPYYYAIRVNACREYAPFFANCR
jgi:hypothetical protein